MNRQRKQAVADEFVDETLSKETFAMNSLYC